MSEDYSDLAVSPVAQDPKADYSDLSVEPIYPSVGGSFWKGLTSIPVGVARSAQIISASPEEQGAMIERAFNEAQRTRTGNLGTSIADIAGNILGGVGVAAAEGAALSETGPAAIAAVGSTFAAAGAGNSFIEAGVRARSEGKSLKEALEIAKKVAPVSGAIQGIAATAIPGASKVIERPLAKAAAVGAIGAGQQVAENVVEQSEGLETPVLQGASTQGGILAATEAVVSALTHKATPLDRMVKQTETGRTEIIADASTIADLKKAGAPATAEALKETAPEPPFEPPGKLPPDTRVKKPWVTVPFDPVEPEPLEKPVIPGEQQVQSRLQRSRDAAKIRQLNKQVAEEPQPDAAADMTGRIPGGADITEVPRPALPEMAEPHSQLVQAILKVAADPKASLEQLYGAVEALPTARRVVEGLISRLEERGEPTDHLYDVLGVFEKFENSYHEAVTKPSPERGKARTRDILPQDEAQRLTQAIAPAPKEVTPSTEKAVEAAPQPSTEPTPVEPPKKEGEVDTKALTDRLDVVNRMIEKPLRKADTPLFEKERQNILYELDSLDALPKDWTKNEKGNYQPVTAETKFTEPTKSEPTAVPAAEGKAPITEHRPDMMLGSGEVATTSSGRKTTPFPKLNLNTNQGTGRTINKVHEWLIKNATDEALSRGDDFNARIFAAEKPNNLPPASVESMNEYLFGRQPEVPRPFLKELKPSQAPVAQAQAEVNPFDTSVTSNRLTELDKQKPRPTAKLYGPSGGTPELRAANDAKIRQWQNARAKAVKEHRAMVEKSNEWIQGQSPEPPVGPSVGPGVEKPVGGGTPDAGEGPGLSGMGAAAYGEIPSSGVLASVSKALRGIRDFFTINPVNALSRVGLGDAAYEHASARNSIVHTVRDLLSRVFPTQYKDPVAMARTGDILTKDNVLGIYDQARAARDAATTPQGVKAAQARMTEIENAHDLMSYDADVRASMQNPEIAGNINRWREVVGPELDRLFNEMKARDPNTPREARGRHFQARVNLLPLDKAADLAGFTDGSQPMPEPSVANYRNPNVKRDPFARRATGTGQYSTDPALMLINSIGSRWNEVTKLRFYDAIVREGHGMIVEPGERTVSEMDGEKLVRMPIKVPETTVTTEIHDGVPVEFEKTKQVEKSLWIKQSLAREARDVLNTDMATPNNPILRALTGIQLLQTTDMVSHLKNIHTVIGNSLGSSKGWQDAVRKMPFLGTADTVGRIIKVTREVMESGPEIRSEIAQMARQGLIRPEYPATGIQKLTHGQQLIHAVDTAARVTMNRFWDNLVERGMVNDSVKGRREFVQQIGEYNRRLLTPFIRAMRDYGASPFIVAGRTFNRFSKRLLTGDPGFKAASPEQAAIARAYQVSGLATAVILPAMINYFTSGKFGGRTGTPIGAIDTGTDNDKGQHRILDVFQLMGIRRGLRATGAGAIIEGVRSGQTANKMFGKAFDDITSTAGHPLLGPGLGALYSGITGKRLDLRGGDNPYLSKNVGGGIKQIGENLRVTLKNQNPVIYGLIAPLVGETEDTYGEGLAKGFLKTPLSSLGLKEQTGTDPKGLIGQLHSNWMERNKDPKVRADYERIQRAVFPTSKYHDLDDALHSKDESKAMDAIKELRKTETDAQIYQRFVKASRGPLFHEAMKHENDFKKTLTSDERAIYDQALKDRTASFKRFTALWARRKSRP